MTSSTYNNGVAESHSYNNDNTLASISFTGGPIGTYSYTWLIGRFLGRDSLGYFDGKNLYAVTARRVLTLVDPPGQSRSLPKPDEPGCKCCCPIL